MDPLRLHDYLTLARQRVFAWLRPLTPDQYLQPFPIGLGSLGRTLTHIMISEWFYVQRLLERPVPPYEAWPIQAEQPPPFPDLEAAWTRQAPETRAALAAVGDWNRVIEYHTLGPEPRKIVTTSPADLVTQLAFHEVHHRAQVLNMLRQLGVTTEDIDFNALMYARRDA